MYKYGNYNNAKHDYGMFIYIECTHVFSRTCMPIIIVLIYKNTVPVKECHNCLFQWLSLLVLAGNKLHHWTSKTPLYSDSYLHFTTCQLAKNRCPRNCLIGRKTRNFTKLHQGIECYVFRYGSVVQLNHFHVNY